MIVWKYRAHFFTLVPLWNKHHRTSNENVTVFLYRQGILSEGNSNVIQCQPFLLRKNLRWSLHRICWRQMFQWESLCWVQTYYLLCSLLTGQKWKDMRSTLSPAFTSSKMKMLFTLMSETSKQLTSHLENRLKEQQAAAEHKPVSY